MDQDTLLVYLLVIEGRLDSYKIHTRSSKLVTYLDLYGSIMAIPPNSNGSHNNFTAPNATNGSNASGTPNTPHDESSDGVRWDIQELQDGEFQHYFREHEGRLFHSHGGLPYPLPVDGLEHEVSLITGSCAVAL